MENQELPHYKWAEIVLEIWVGKKKILSFLKDDNGSENGQWMKENACSPHVKFYFFLSTFSLFFFNLHYHFSCHSSFPYSQPSCLLESKIQTKNDENLFCLLLFLAGKLLEGPPSFSQRVYTVHLNKYDKAYLDSFDFFTSEAYYLIYATANYTLQIKREMRRSK